MRSPSELYSRPVVPLLLAFIAGIIIGTEAPGLRVWAYAFLLVVAGRILIAVWHHSRAKLAPIFMFLVIGYLAIQPWVSPRFSDNHISRFVSDAHWRISGVVNSRPETTSRFTKCLFEVETLGHGTRKVAAFGKIRLTVSNPTFDLNLGDRLTFSSRLRVLHSFKNPGGFDYRRHMAFKGVWASAYAKGYRLARVEPQFPRGFHSWVSDARRKVSALILKSTPGDHQGVLKALLIGDRSQISAQLRDAFHRAGVGHLLAISGLHVGIVTATAFYFFAWLLARFKLVLWQGWSRKGAAILAIIAAGLYACLAGMSPSTQRALIMVSVYLLTYVLEKEHDLLNTLAIAALLIVATSPTAIYSISFQLSFISVLAIIYGITLVPASGVHKAGGKWTHIALVWRHRIFVFLMVSFFAVMGTLPIVMKYFNQVSLIGIFANCIFIPLIGFVVVPLGLISVAVLPLSTVLAAAGINLCGHLLMLTLDVLHWAANLPFAAVKTFTPSTIEIVCYYVLLWTAIQCGFDREKTGKKANPEMDIRISDVRAIATAHRMKTFLGVHKRAILTILMVAVTLVDVHYWVYQRYWRKNMEVTILDVGHGNAALLELPRGHCVLIDGGGFSDNSVFDIGARVVAPFLWRKKIKTVDTVVLSHPNSDHLNGLIYIFKHFNVETVWSNNETANTIGYRQFRKLIEEKNITLVDFEKRPLKSLIGGVHFEILYPFKGFLKKIDHQPWRNTNNNSLVLRVTMKDHSILFPGDIMAMAEKELVSRVGEGLNSHVLIVPHHGSNSSSTSLFLKKVKARYAIISSRSTTRNRSPHPSVMRRLRRHDCRIFCTNEHGAVIIQTDGQKMILKTPLGEAQFAQMPCR